MKKENIKIDQTIYKLDSKGKVRFLRIETDNDKICQTSGILGSAGGVLSVSSCEGKNFGRSNATTPYMQALLEAEAKITSKLQEGYYKTVEEAQQGVLILPMLAKDFKKEEKKVTYPCYVQPKLDGMRALKSFDNMISRKNRTISTMNHIEKELHNLDLHTWGTLDGELYAHGETFQRNMELIKKYREGETEKVKYHVYDMVMPDVSFKDRFGLIETLFGNLEHVKIVPTFVVNNKEELLQKHKEFLEAGYEGTMVRHGNDGYEPNKRSSSLLKFKDFIDISCKIVNVQPSEKRPDQGIFICETDDGKPFGCGMRFSHEERANILLNKDKYIGQVAEIRFFEWTNEGIPRFPVCVGLRLDK